MTDEPHPKVIWEDTPTDDLSRMVPWGWAWNGQVVPFRGAPSQAPHRGRRAALTAIAAAAAFALGLAWGYVANTILGWPNPTRPTVAFVTLAATAWGIVTATRDAT